MFVLDPAQTFVDLTGRSLYTLIQSINQPMVAASEHPAEETQAFVVTLQSREQTFETFIYLHLQESNQCVIYRSSQSPFLGDHLEEVEGIALDFVESMGFMMDNMRVNRLSPPERKSLILETPAFYSDLKKFEPYLKSRMELKHREIVNLDEEMMPQDSLESPDLEQEEVLPLEDTLVERESPPPQSDDFEEYFDPSRRLKPEEGTTEEELELPEMEESSSPLMELEPEDVVSGESKEPNQEDLTALKRMEGHLEKQINKMAKKKSMNLASSSISSKKLAISAEEWKSMIRLLLSL